MNRNNFAFYTEFGINKTLDLINVSDSNSILNIFLLLSTAFQKVNLKSFLRTCYLINYLSNIFKKMF